MWRGISFRGRLVLLGFGLQVLTLALVGLSTASLVDVYLESQLQSRARQLKPLLVAALAVPMAQRDYASVAAILTELCADGELTHLRVQDAGGNPIAGEDPTRKAPQARLASASQAFATDITMSGQSLGKVDFGLSRESPLATRDQIITKIALIGVFALGLFTLLLGPLARALTRPLEAVANASRSIQAGDYDVRLDTRTSGEIGALNDAFGKMTREIKAKVADLTRMEALQRHYLGESLEKQALIEVALKKAEEANEAKSTFLANMSHEIRTPMNAIIGYAELAREISHDPTQRGYIAQVQSAGAALLDVLNDILDHSKIEAGHLEIVCEPFRLARLIDGISDIFAPQFAQKGLVLRREIDPSLPQWLSGDALRLRQVLLNLVGNALKFTQQGEVSIRVTGGAPSDSGIPVVISVSDTGIGVTPDQAQRIFQPFTQADGSITRRFGGTGLGLSISRELMRLMGGEIELESTPDKGSVFRLRLMLPLAEPGDERTAHGLPLNESEQSGTDTDPSRPPTIGLHAAQALVVEDNPDNARLLTLLLEQAGIRVVNAMDGLEAMEQIAQHRFDLILMDLQMPRMDGLQAARKIRAVLGESTPPIIAISASAMPSDRQASLDAGMADLLAKPISKERLLACLRHLAQDSPVASERPTLLPKPIDRSELDGLLETLRSKLEDHLLNARQVVESIELLLSRTDLMAPFEPVARATRRLAFEEALDALDRFHQSRSENR
ncbi:MAG: ATP-binding protein [Burkholderiales bacterium]|nr:ATP-binding protein [Burkholderiales bacterium]